MIRAILFDFGGVLGSEAHDWGGALLPVTHTAGLSVGEMEGLWHLHWKTLVIGVSDLAAFWNDVSQASPHHPSPELLAHAFFSALTLNEDVLQLARDLKVHGLHLVIAANESRTGMDTKIRKFRLADTFEKVYCSAHMGFAKPDPMFFSYILHDLGVRADEAIVIDNQAANIAAAEELGVRSILFQNAAQVRIALEGIFGHSLYR